MRKQPRVYLAVLTCLSLYTLNMATRDKEPPSTGFTTNELDQQEVARLKTRLEEQKKNKSSRGSSGPYERLPSVEIAKGTHKYVQIKAIYDGEEQIFVTSKKGAHYHRNAAEPFIAKLEEAGYEDIEVRGGGRIALDEDRKVISIYGHSYGFGLADHSLSRAVVKEDERYKDFEINISNEGY